MPAYSTPETTGEPPTSEPFICLLTTPADLCHGCGEWLHSERRGGYPGPDGHHFCAEWCIEAHLELLEQARRPSRVTGCRSCGLDNFEHEPGCEAPR